MATRLPEVADGARSAPMATTLRSSPTVLRRLAPNWRTSATAVMRELGRPRGLLRDALRLYTTRSCYLAGVEGAVHIGLDGESRGRVTAERVAAAQLWERGL